MIGREFKEEGPMPFTGKGQGQYNQLLVGLRQRSSLLPKTEALNLAQARLLTALAEASIRSFTPHGSIAEPRFDARGVLGELLNRYPEGQFPRRRLIAEGGAPSHAWRELPLPKYPEGDRQKRYILWPGLRDTPQEEGALSPHYYIDTSPYVGLIDETTAGSSIYGGSDYPPITKIPEGTDAVLNSEPDTTFGVRPMNEGESTIIPPTEQ